MERGLTYPALAMPAPGEATVVAPGVLWLRLPPGLDSAALLPQAVAKGVAYVPGIPFYGGTPDTRTLRLSFVTATAEEIDRGIAALAQTVREAVAQQAAGHTA